MSVRIYPDVCVLLTLDFSQRRFLRECVVFQDSIKQLGLSTYLLPTVKNIREKIIDEIITACGSTLRGLIIRFSTIKTRGMRHYLEGAPLVAEDSIIIQQFFRRQIGQQEYDLVKQELHVIEVWVISEFKKALDNGLSMIDFLQTLSHHINEVYVEIKNRALKTNNDLELIDEDIPQPSIDEIETINNLLGEHGFNDREDALHLAALKKCHETKKVTAIFATTDLKLHEQQDYILDKIGVLVELPLYVIERYNSLR